MQRHSLILAALLACACESSQTHAQAEFVPLTPAAPPAPARLQFDVVAPYPATLVYALDRAGWRGHQDPRYRAWLFGAAEAAAPEWFRAYDELRRRTRRSVDQGDGSYEPFVACSYDNATLEAALACAEQQLTPSESFVLRSALERADALLQPHWLELQPALGAFQRGIEQLTSGNDGRELARILAEAARLPGDQQLAFQVVLVAKPAADVYHAQQEGHHLVVEVDRKRTPESQTHVLFHEIAHLAAKHAPARGALDAAFAGHGDAGLVAGNLWNEAFATAFGNGLAAARFDPTFQAQRSLYVDAGIDALGRALYLEWRSGKSVALDAAFAERMIELVGAAWPPARWRRKDLFTRVQVVSEHQEASAALERALRPRSLDSRTPLSPDLTEWAEPADVPRILLASVGSLRARRAMLARFGLAPRDLEQHVSAHGASAFLRTDEGGIAWLLITARSFKRLVAAASAFDAGGPLPQPGWTTLDEGADE
jgi:hypothetical protein